jgi:hypothetical protein
VTARLAVFQLDDVENFVLTLKDEVVQAQQHLGSLADRPLRP